VTTFSVIVFTALFCSVKLLCIYLCFTVFILVLGEKDALVNVSFALLMKIIILSDFAVLLGDAFYLTMLNVNDIAVTDLGDFYQGYPLSIASIMEMNMLMSGLLKDLNAFNLFAILIFAYGTNYLLKVGKRRSFEIAVFSYFTYLLIGNLLWILLIISFKDAIS
jgi:hypothetical protein